MEHVLLLQINRFKFMFHTLSGCSPKYLLICCIANLLTQVDRFYIFPFQRAFGPLLQNKIRLLLKKKISLVSTLLNNHNDFVTIASGFWCGILWFNWCQKLDNNLSVYGRVSPCGMPWHSFRLAIVSLPDTRNVTI